MCSKLADPNDFVSGLFGSSILIVCFSTWCAPAHPPIMSANSGQLLPAKRHGVMSADTAAFADEAQDPVANLGIVVDHPADVVQIDGIEFLDLRILQEVEVVAERRLERAGVLSHQLEEQVAVRDRGMSRIHLDVGDRAVCALFSA
jgi:hypothetical protein